MGARSFLKIPLAALPLAVLGCSREAGTAPPPPPVEVLVAEVLERDVPIYVEAIGQTRGSSEVEIRSRVEGFVESVDFAEGTMVEQGALLYTIDPRPFEAELARAKAAEAEAEAVLARASQDVARYEPLVAKNAISRQEYETSVAAERAARASLAAASAVVESAEIDLGFTRIVAPGAGMIGKTEVFPGTLVNRGLGVPLTQISKIDPIHARVTISERDYLHYARKAEGKEPAADGAGPTFELVLTDRSVHAPPGKLVFVDRNVDPRSGTMLIEVAFPNPGGIVRPGQFARVRIAVETRAGALLVPQRAVQELQGIYNVAVLRDDQTIEVRPVELGERIGNLWVVRSGLKPGETIVVEGMQKVRPGTKVAPKVVEIGAEPEDPARAASDSPSEAQQGDSKPSEAQSGDEE